MSAEVTEGKYTIELCRPGGPGAGIEGAIASDDDLTTARALARILARSDRPETMPGLIHINAAGRARCHKF
jgi:hypothetical protein